MNIFFFPIKLFNFILLIVNMFYPIINLLFNKNLHYSINNINKTISTSINKLSIDKIYQDDFIK
jgi:hypothetical protein